MNDIAIHPDRPIPPFRLRRQALSKLTRRKPATMLVTGLFCCAMSLSAEAANGYTDSASFLSALTGPAITVNFDGAIAGTVIPDRSTFDNIAISSNTGLDLLVSDHFDTSSPFNYLGVDDGFSNEFVSGDEIFFQFSAPVVAFGLFITGSPLQILDNDFQLVGGGASVFNAGGPELTLADGGELFFLGLIDTAGFSSVRLNSFGDPGNPFFAFNVDDLSYVNRVPEPADSTLLLLGLLAMAGTQRRIRNRPFVTLKNLNHQEIPS